MMSIQIFKAKGWVEYGPGLRCVLRVDQGIANFYKSLIPKTIWVNGMRNPAHITIVRTGVEIPGNLANWGVDSGKWLTYTYCNEIKLDKYYAVLPVMSNDIGDLREKLGLPRYRIGHTKYHITIGNFKC
jgi:hypothetical protein